MSKSYSVMWDPVIPVSFLDGSSDEIGIRETFVRAHEIADLQCDSPLERYALFRLLVAFAIDMIRPERAADRKALLKKGHFDAAVMDDYIAACEQDGPRFDLFDPKHPFMQAAYDPVMDEKAVKPAAKLEVSLPSGNNHIFLDHRPETIPTMDPAEAFRAMISLYVFCTAGAQGYPSGVNNTPPVYSRVIGRSLFETIVLNMVAAREHPTIETGSVPWRSNETVVPKQECVSMTLLEALTWQPRRITLMQDEDGRVRSIALQQGKNFRGNELWRDPHIAYRCTPKGEWSSVKPQAGRALWRDIGTLLSDSAHARFRPPLTVSQSGELLDSVSVPLIIQQIGLVTSQASYVSWTEDRLSIPICLLEDDLLASFIREDAEISESAQRTLVQGVNANYSHDKKKSVDLAEQARSHFLGQMHDILFSFSIPDVCRIRDEIPDDFRSEHIKRFSELTEEALKNTLREVVQASGSTAKDLQKQVETQRAVISWFRKSIREKEEDNE